MEFQNFGTIAFWLHFEVRYKQKEILKMATAKKVAPKAVKVAKTVTAPAKAAMPVAKVAAKKAPVSKTAKVIAKLGEQIAKLTERKNKIGTEIAALRDQRSDDATWRLSDFAAIREDRYSILECHRPAALRR